LKNISHSLLFPVLYNFSIGQPFYSIALVGSAMMSLQLRRSNSKLSNRCFPAKLAQFRHKKAKCPTLAWICVCRWERVRFIKFLLELGDIINMPTRETNQCEDARTLKWPEGDLVNAPHWSVCNSQHETFSSHKSTWTANPRCPSHELQPGVIFTRY